MPRQRLFDHAPMGRVVSRCRDLVPLPTDQCVACGSATHETTIGEMALFRHGGYGADRVTVFRLCDNDECRSVRLVCVGETNPRSAHHEGNTDTPERRQKDVSRR